MGNAWPNTAVNTCAASVSTPMPARFPAVDPGAVRLTNQWLRPRGSIECSLAGSACTVQVEATPEPFDDDLSVTFEWGEEAGLVRLPIAWLAEVFGGETTASLQRARPDQRCLLLEFLLLDVLEAVEQALGQRLQCTASALPVASLPVRLGLNVSSAAWQGTLGLELGLSAAETLLQLLDIRSPASPSQLDWLPVPVSVASGWQRLSRAELDSLHVGDVVMLDRPFEGVRVCFADRLQAFASLIPGGLRLDDTPYPFPSHRESLMEQSPDTLATHLPVTLVCEVGRLEVTLQTLGELVAGSVLPLPDQAGQQVALHANGKLFGHGELVMLGDGLGVRLTGRVSHE